MPKSRYELLDEKMDRVLAEFGGDHGIHAKLSRMDERQENHGKKIDELVERVGKQNGRVTKLEDNTGKLGNRVWWIIGIGSATAATVGVFLVKLLDHVTK